MIALRRATPTRVHTLSLNTPTRWLMTPCHSCFTASPPLRHLSYTCAAAYAKVVAALNSIFHVFFGWIPGVATACTGLGLAHELLIICLVPLFIVLASFGVALLRRRSAISALPFSFVVSFLCYPFVASRGFRALAPCDCFAYIDGVPSACFLRDAYSVKCVRLASGAYAAPGGVRATAWLAICVYAIFVPLMYGSLLFASRKSLSGRSAPTMLSRAMLFLSRDYATECFAWELVEVLRKLTITGFLALVKPGSLLQLYLGVTIALCILILQLYARPYATYTDNFLSTLSASALVLTLLASLGIQLTGLAPELSLLGQELTGLSNDAFPVIVGVLIASALLVLIVALSMFARGLTEAQSLPVARWARDQHVALPRSLAAKRFHTFVSHQVRQSRRPSRR